MNAESHISEDSTVTIRWKVWEELLKVAGRQIDPATAEVVWCWGDICNPYGIFPNKNVCLGRLHFARGPGTNIWIEFHDLPEATRVTLEQSANSREPDDDVPW
jgi:hypothetical protein